MPSHPRLNTAPSASGAENSYPLNETFDVKIQSAGTGPQNADFETAARAVGTARPNSGFESPPGITGTPPTNYDFASGDFSGWTKTSEPTIASDQPHGSFAKLNGGTITSSPFTVDPGTQNLPVDVGYFDPGDAWFRVYILTGTGDTTQTQLLSTNCYACQYWRTETTNLSAYPGQSVELPFTTYFGSVAVDTVKPMSTFPGWTVSGNASRATEQNGNTYAAMHGGSRTTSSFTVDPTAQDGSLRIDGLSGSDNSSTIKVLSGTGFSTATRVASGYATPNAWSTIPFTVTQWQGQPVEVQVIQTTYDIGVDDVALQSIAVAGWTPNGTASVISGGPTGNYVTTDNLLTANAFTLDPSV
ncbi:MAG: hypothetical protein ACR2PL_28570 [Dehalococcoidia bacterium]